MTKVVNHPGSVRCSALDEKYIYTGGTEKVVRMFDKIVILFDIDSI